MTKPDKLTPPDLERCQVEWLGGSFMTLGPRTMERCTKKPDWVATEKTVGKDGQRGSMSLCEEHRKVFIEKYPQRATFKSVNELNLIVCYGCGLSTPPVSRMNIAGDYVHTISKCMKRALSKRTKELHRIIGRKVESGNYE